MARQGISRRRALYLGACAGTGLLSLGNASLGIAAVESKRMNAEVSANEDLMREHGALIRLLLVSGEAARRLKNGEVDSAAVLRASTEVIRKFIDEYHERIEERYIFPRFEGNTELAGLVRVLNTQHEAGRGVTKRILELTKAEMDSAERNEAHRLVESFARMYYPHMGREDTVLFPAFRTSMSEREYEQMGEQFEEEEHKLLGEGGYEKIVASVADLEKELGIYDLARFTPRA